MMSRRPTQADGASTRGSAAERAHRTVANARDLHPLQPIVIEMYRSLHLAPAMEDMVGAVMERAQLRDNAFGCVHARVEDDAKHLSWTTSNAKHLGGLPTLKQYLAAASGLVTHTRNSGEWPVFIATSDPLPSRQDPGVRWVQSPLKTGMDSETVHANVSISYLVASLVDLAVCRRARWFAGFHLSSFRESWPNTRASTKAEAGQACAHPGRVTSAPISSVCSTRIGRCAPSTAAS